MFHYDTLTLMTASKERPPINCTFKCHHTGIHSCFNMWMPWGIADYNFPIWSSVNNNDLRKNRTEEQPSSSPITIKSLTLTQALPWPYRLLCSLCFCLFVCVLFCLLACLFYVLPGLYAFHLKTLISLDPIYSTMHFFLPLSYFLFFNFLSLLLL